MPPDGRTEIPCENGWGGSLSPISAGTGKGFSRRPVSRIIGAREKTIPNEK